MNATDTVAMNFTMIMHENNRWCKMKMAAEMVQNEIWQQVMQNENGD